MKEAAAAAVVVGGEARSCSQTLKRARHALWSRGCAGGHCTLCNMGSRRSEGREGGSARRSQEVRPTISVECAKFLREVVNVLDRSG